MFCNLNFRLNRRHTDFALQIAMRTGINYSLYELILASKLSVPIASISNDNNVVELWIQINN